MKRAHEKDIVPKEAVLLPIPDLILELERVKKAEDELAEKKRRAIENLDKSMRPVYILRGRYATRGAPQKNKVIGAFSTFSQAHTAKLDCEKKGGRKMVVEAIPHAILGKWPYYKFKLDGKLDTDGYVSP
jgi:hypothetical protein